MRLVLASASERRKELLQRLCIEFEILVSDFDENSICFTEDCSKYVQIISEGKVLDVVRKLQGTESSIVIGSDTIVSIHGEILGKPKSKKDAFTMLKKLSGETHEVYSGITVYDTEKKIMMSDFQCTKVIFSEIKDEVIKWYIETGEPMDKAGAYGIQGYAGAFVEGIQGCYYNVVGLPLNKLSFMLREMGVSLYKGAKKI